MTNETFNSNFATRLDFTFFEATPGMRVVYLPDSPSFTIFAISKDMCQFVGLPKEQLVGRSVFDAFPANPADTEFTGHKNLRAALEFVVQHKTSHQMEMQRYDVAIDGGAFKEIYWQNNSVPLLNEKGEVAYIIHTAEDITEKIRLEGLGRMAMEANEFQAKVLYNLFMQAPVAVAIFRGPDHIIELANKAHLDIWGRTAEEVMGKPTIEALPELKGQGFEELLHNVLQTGESYFAQEYYINLIRNRKEERVYFNFVYQPLKDLNGAISGVIAVANDVSEQVMARQRAEQHEADLERANTELKYINANLEKFAYAASHDLKEPVRKAHYFADRLKIELGSQLTESQGRLFDRMSRSVRRMGTLIDDLLVYSHVSQGVANMENIDLNKKVQSVLDDLELEIAEREAMITINPLPVVKGERRQLQQLFQNLISNALKYTRPHDKPQIHISSRQIKGKETALALSNCEGDKYFHLIEVKDKGIGFEQSDADRIFNVFTRLHGNTEYKGSGIGLSIVRKAVENHNGYIWAESQPGQGATFNVLLPVS